MDASGAWRWVKTSGLAALGGGIAAVVATVADPTKYHFPRDLGSGKMWPFFFSGAGMTLGALLVRSPLGQQVISTYKESQAQLEADREAFEKIKAAIKEKGKPEETKP